MRRSLAKFSESEASNHTPFLAGFTTTTLELKLSVHTKYQDSLSLSLVWLAPPKCGSLNSAQIRGTLVPVEEVAVGTEITLRPPAQNPAGAANAPGSHLGW